jgi:hypothetical protein
LPDLSSTSALVLLWAGQESYKSRLAKDYFNLLDLEPGKVLYEQCNEICPYYDEVIKNRKLGVTDLINKCLTGNNNIGQIIIAGAGLDPLGIEITNYFPQIKVFELDMENMEIKSVLYLKIMRSSKTAISFINVNIQSAPDVYKALSEHGWDTSEGTLLIGEGISYYLPTASLQNLIKIIKPKRTVLEFLKPNNEINEEREKIAHKVFSLISDAYGGLEIIRYSNSTIESLLGLPVITSYSMYKLEKLRTGSNKYFPSNESGWIEICLLGNEKEK